MEWAPGTPCPSTTTITSTQLTTVRVLSEIRKIEAKKITYRPVMQQPVPVRSSLCSMVSMWLPVPTTLPTSRNKYFRTLIAFLTIGINSSFVSIATPTPPPPLCWNGLPDEYAPYCCPNGAQNWECEIVSE